MKRGDKVVVKEIPSFRNLKPVIEIGTKPISDHEIEIHLAVDEMYDTPVNAEFCFIVQVEQIVEWIKFIGYVETAELLKE